MKKEMSIILISFRSILNYKSSVLLLMLQASIQIMISVFLWTYIYQSNQINIAGYDFTSMVQYYLGTIIFSYFVFYPVDWEINDDVHSGNFFGILIKPVTFYKYYFCKMLGDRLAHLLFIIIPVIFFSNNFRLFLDVLPFKYLVYEPLQMFSNDTYKLIDYLRIICIQLIWCVIFYIISRFILRKGVEHFSNVGG